MCYHIRTLGVEGLETTIDRTVISEIDPKFGLSILRSNSKIISNELNLKYFKIEIFVSDCF